MQPLTLAELQLVCDELFPLCSISASSQLATAAPSDDVVELDSGQLGTEFWKTKYEQLEEQCRVINEQKVRL